MFKKPVNSVTVECQENFENVKEVKLKGDHIAVHRCLTEYSTTRLNTGIVEP